MLDLSRLYLLPTTTAHIQPPSGPRSRRRDQLMTTKGLKYDDQDLAMAVGQLTVPVHSLVYFLVPPLCFDNNTSSNFTRRPSSLVPIVNFSTDLRTPGNGIKLFKTFLAASATQPQMPIIIDQLQSNIVNNPKSTVVLSVQVALRRWHMPTYSAVY